VCALGQQQLCAGATDSAGRSGDESDLSGEGPRLFRSRELGPLQAPVFDVEQLELADWPIDADRERVADHRRGVRPDVTGDARVLARFPDAGRAQPGHDDDARQPVDRRNVAILLGTAALDAPRLE
jgi:hypothetical protein